MNSPETLHFKTCLFTEAAQSIQRVRAEVFQQEQGITASLDFDGQDPQCVHLLAQVQGETVGVARLRELEQSTVKLERLAVQQSYRNQGLGSEMVATAIAYTQAMGYRHLKLHAQISSVEFYRRLGFKTVSEIFSEAGIEHIKMELSLLKEIAPQ